MRAIQAHNEHLLHALLSQVTDLTHAQEELATEIATFQEMRRKLAEYDGYLQELRKLAVAARTAIKEKSAPPDVTIHLGLPRGAFATPEEPAVPSDLSYDTLRQRFARRGGRPSAAIDEDPDDRVDYAEFSVVDDEDST